jgi:hypothetical protein
MTSTWKWYSITNFSDWLSQKLNMRMRYGHVYLWWSTEGAIVLGMHAPEFESNLMLGLVFKALYPFPVFLQTCQHCFCSYNCVENCVMFVKISVLG